MNKLLRNLTPFRQHVVLLYNLFSCIMNANKSVLQHWSKVCVIWLSKKNIYIPILIEGLVNVNAKVNIVLPLPEFKMATIWIFLLGFVFPKPQMLFGGSLTRAISRCGFALRRMLAKVRFCIASHSWNDAFLLAMALEIWVWLVTRERTREAKKCISNWNV